MLCASSDSLATEAKRSLHTMKVHQQANGRSIFNPITSHK